MTVFRGFDLLARDYFFRGRTIDIGNLDESMWVQDSSCFGPLHVLADGDKPEKIFNYRKKRFFH